MHSDPKQSDPLKSDVNAAVRQQEAGTDPPGDPDSGPAPAGEDDNPDATPQAGGYAGRDPKADMPAMPSIPETQDEPATHDAAPDGDKASDPHK